MTRRESHRFRRRRLAFSTPEQRKERRLSPSAREDIIMLDKAPNGTRKRDQVKSTTPAS